MLARQQGKRQLSLHLIKPPSLGPPPNGKRENTCRSQNTPDEDHAQRARRLAVNMLDRLAQLDVHVRVDRDQAALVLGVPPLQTDDDGLVDTVAIEELVVPAV